ncbi:MAG: pyridoxamine 5'-phosphate oxidase family protein [Deltaproteobacteria bacterium]|nr:pyridoxamine 5'-phosphate oxidase family protein [Deltaproteobacteria bacterium]
MRIKEREIKDRKDVEKILRESRVCRLAMVDGDKPYVVPLNFGYKDGFLFFHSAKEGRKIDLIKKNPNVCFEVDKLIRLKKAKCACDFGIEYKSVIGSGTAEFLDDLEEKIEGLNAIMSQYSGRQFEYTNKMLEKTIVIKVTIDTMTGKQS